MNGSGMLNVLVAYANIIFDNNVKYTDKGPSLNYFYHFSLTDERLDERDGEQSAAILFDLYKKAIFNNSR